MSFNAELAAYIISVYSLHTMLATVATYAIVTVPRPVSVTGWIFAAWFCPLAGPLAGLVWASLPDGLPGFSIQKKSAAHTGDASSKKHWKDGAYSALS